MQTLRLEQLASLTEARLIRGEPHTLVQRISTDTRTLRAGDCFLALRGPRYDGHDFVPAAARSGAVAAVVSNPTRAMNSPSALALLQVQDTLTALHKLATNYRRQLPRTTRVIAVTGSCGKTTTKELIAAVLGERFQLVKTTDNHNNQIGLPLELLRLDATHDFGVFELGTSKPGEIATLAAIAQPEIGVITNIGLAHVEALGDEAGVAREKGALLERLPNNGDGLAVLNADDPWTNSLRNRTRATIVTVGIDTFADIRATDIQTNGNLKFRLRIAKKRDDVIIHLNTLGRHQIYNALQAAAVAYFLGMDLDEIRFGLEAAALPQMRMQPVQRAGIRFLNDSYNANPGSMRAALHALRDAPCTGRKIAVLGDMLELGPYSRTAHEQIGATAARTGLAYLITVGQLARHIADGALAHGLEPHRIFSLQTATDAAHTLQAITQPDDIVLLKASRAIQLEHILQELDTP